MIRYYTRLLKHLPRYLWTSVGKVQSITGFVAFILLLLNRPLAAQVSAWEGLDPRFSVLPVVALAIYGLLKSNFEHVSRLDGAFVLFPEEAAGHEAAWLHDYLADQVRFSGSRAYFRILRLEFKLEAPNPLLTLFLSISNGTPYTLRLGGHTESRIAIDRPRSKGGVTFRKPPELRGRPVECGIPPSGRDDAQILQFLDEDEAGELLTRLASGSPSLTLHFDEVDFVVHGSWPAGAQTLQQNRRLWLSDAEFALPGGACVRHGGFP